MARERLSPLLLREWGVGAGAEPGRSQPPPRLSGPRPPRNQPDPAAATALWLFVLMQEAGGGRGPTAERM